MSDTSILPVAMGARERVGRKRTFDFDINAIDVAGDLGRDARGDFALQILDIDLENIDTAVAMENFSDDLVGIATGDGEVAAGLQADAAVASGFFPAEFDTAIRWTDGDFLEAVARGKGLEIAAQAFDVEGEWFVQVDERMRSGGEKPGGGNSDVGAEVNDDAVAGGGGVVEAAEDFVQSENVVVAVDRERERAGRSIDAEVSRVVAAAEEVAAEGIEGTVVDTQHIAGREVVPLLEQCG